MKDLKPFAASVTNQSNRVHFNESLEAGVANSAVAQSQGINNYFSMVHFYILVVLFYLYEERLDLQKLAHQRTDKAFASHHDDLYA